MTFSRRSFLRTSTLALGALATGSALSACSSSSSPASAANTVTYWLWDSAQQPAYQACADAFAAENPGTHVQIIQYNWDDYWTKLTAGFISDTAPDVFTNHLAKYPQLVDLEVLYPLEELAATKAIDYSQFQDGLANVWTGLDNKHYGSPKDFDTIAYFYHKPVLAAAGITPEDFNTATWNSTDGGTFEKLIARLTIDTKGIRGDQPGFNPRSVATYGLGSTGAGGDNFGQTQWGMFTGSIDAKFALTDKNPWANNFNLTNKGFQDMLTWYFGLGTRGYMAPYAVAQGLSSDQQVSAGKAALGPNGSWMINTFAKLKVKDPSGASVPIDLGIAPSPIGPSGKNASPFNGLGDSVTRQAKNPELAGKWVAFLASAKAQEIVGRSGVVLPARKDCTQFSVDYHQQEQGINIDAFMDHISNHTTQLLTVTRNAAQVSAAATPAFDNLYLGNDKPSSLSQLNEQLDAILRQ